MKVLVASQNPVKIAAVASAFSNFFSDCQTTGKSAPSGVADQPLNEATFAGAENRARFLLENHADQADYFVGIEGGLIHCFNTWLALGAVCIMNSKGVKGLGISPGFQLPDKIIARLQAGEELGHVIDAISGEHNTKQKSGAIGFLTNEVMDREKLYVSGIIMALVPFLNQPIFTE